MYVYIVSLYVYKHEQHNYNCDKNNLSNFVFNKLVYNKKKQNFANESSKKKTKLCVFNYSYDLLACI